MSGSEASWGVEFDVCVPVLLAVLDEVLGNRTVTYDGVKLDFGADWPEVDYRTEIARRTGLDLTVVRDLSTLREHVERRHLTGRA